MYTVDVRIQQLVVITCSTMSFTCTHVYHHFVDYANYN